MKNILLAAGVSFLLFTINSIAWADPADTMPTSAPTSGASDTPKTPEPAVPGHPNPCDALMDDCKAGGFTYSGPKGNNLFQDCFFPLMNGGAGPSNVTASPQDIKLCKYGAKPDEGTAVIDTSKAPATPPPASTTTETTTTTKPAKPTTYSDPGG